MTTRHAIGGVKMRHLGAAKIIERLPGSRELALTYAGVDPIFEPVPVRPA